MSSMQTIAGTCQQQVATPRLQQAVKLLLMSTAEFQQNLRTQLELNPFLECDDDEYESLEGDDDATDLGDEEFDDEPMPVGSASSLDPAGGAIAQRRLRDHLLDQLCRVRVEAPQRQLVDAIVWSLDEDGFLRDGRVELEATLGRSIDEADWNCAVRLVQSLDPAGIGARDLRECLLLQLAHDTDNVSVLLARTLLVEHFEDMAEHRWPAICRKTGVTTEELRAAIDAIRELDPRPARRFSDDAVEAAVPDVHAVRRAGRWTAVLNAGIVPKIRLASTYVDTVKHQRASCPELVDQLREARWTLKNIAQRLQTIEQVAAAIVARQEAFFVHGPMALKPLQLADIAQDVGVHESTISRVTTGKYIASPFGTLELKYFFSRGLPACEKGPASTAVRRLIEETLRNESPGAPLSDAEIARRLHRQGLSIARRTVTKYRQQMGIAAVEVRKLDYELVGS